MANIHIKLEDFLMLWSQEVGNKTTNSTMRKYFKGFKNMILRQLKLNGEIYIQDIGTLYLREFGGEIRNMGDPLNGGTVKRFIAPRYQIGFRPSAMLERAVNENDFTFEAKPSKRKYTKYQYKEIRAERARKPKPTTEDIFCIISNKIEEDRRNEAQIRQEDGN